MLQFQREFDLAFVAVGELAECFDEQADDGGWGKTQVGTDALDALFLIRLQANGECCLFSHAGRKTHFCAVRNMFAGIVRIYADLCERIDLVDGGEYCTRNVIPE